MFRTDTDGLLVWVTKEGDPALIFDQWYEGSTSPYNWVVAIRSTDGDMVTQTRYKSAKEALHAFVELLPTE